VNETSSLLHRPGMTNRGVSPKNVKRQDLTPECAVPSANRSLLNKRKADSDLIGVGSIGLTSPFTCAMPASALKGRHSVSYNVDVKGAS